jgi:glutamyl-tRNA synthetase
MQRLMPLCHSRIKTFGDFMDLFNFLFINHLHYEESLFVIKEISQEQICYLIQALIWRLDELENWSGMGINQASREIAEVFGINHKKIVMPILFASLMGKTQGPPLFDSVTLLGKDRTRARLLKALEFLGGISNKKMGSLKKAWQDKNGHSLMTKE